MYHYTAEFSWVLFINPPHLYVFAIVFGIAQSTVVSSNGSSGAQVLWNTAVNYAVRSPINRIYVKGTRYRLFINKN